MSKCETILGAKIHPMAAEFPLLEGDEFNQLVESIDKHGIQTPILVLHNPRLAKHEPLTVVDGRNRLRAWERLVQQGRQDRDGWQDYIEVLADHGDPNDEDYIRRSILAANIHRRHLTPDQRAAIMLRLTGEKIIKQAAEAKAKTQPKKGSKVNQKSGSPKKRDAKEMHANSAAGQLAAAAKVGRHVAANALKVAKAEESGTLPTGTMKAVEDGKRKLSDAAKAIPAKKAKSRAVMNWTDPGIGDATAPVGSEEWAKRWRLEMQAAMKNATNDQDRVCRLWQFGDEHRAWTKLNRRDGKLFKDWREFVAETVPWGLGSKPDAVQAIIQLADKLSPDQMLSKINYWATEFLEAAPERADELCGLLRIWAERITKQAESQN